MRKYFEISDNTFILLKERWNKMIIELSLNSFDDTGLNPPLFIEVPVPNRKVSGHVFVC